MCSRICSFFRHSTLLLLLFALTSCGSLWVQYQQRKVSLQTQMATGRITRRVYNQKIAELEKWYERGGHTSSSSGRKSGSSTKKASDSASTETSPIMSSSPSSSSSNGAYPRSTDGMHDVTRKTKSGINEF
ncbi:hypothetical protein [Prosthecobacter sp.]|uniref:hypothetical protein n=1 Tax=Prosthecobacter sp. TaxID=1965333 RepID=UPI0037843986